VRSATRQGDQPGDQPWQRCRARVPSHGVPRRRAPPSGSAGNLRRCNRRGVREEFPRAARVERPARRLLDTIRRIENSIQLQANVRTARLDRATRRLLVALCACHPRPLVARKGLVVRPVEEILGGVRHSRHLACEVPGISGSVAAHGVHPLDERHPVENTPALVEYVRPVKSLMTTGLNPVHFCFFPS
jgi:hypothetical protein